MRTYVGALCSLLIAGGTSGCSGIVTQGSPPAIRALEEPVYLGPLTARIPREHLDRYACTNDDPLLCACRGRVSACDCRCAQ